MSKDNLEENSGNLIKKLYIGIVTGIIVTLGGFGGWLVHERYGTKIYYASGQVTIQNRDVGGGISRYCAYENGKDVLFLDKGPYAMWISEDSAGKVKLSGEFENIKGTFNILPKEGSHAFIHLHNCLKEKREQFAKYIPFKEIKDKIK